MVHYVHYGGEGVAAEPELLITVCLCQETESRQRVEPGYNP